jgi:hypothetical protein
VDDTNILVIKNTIRKNTDHLLVSRREEGIAINAGKITYVFISQQKAESNHNKDKVFKDVAWFKCLGMTTGYHKTPSVGRKQFMTQ